MPLSFIPPAVRKEEESKQETNVGGERRLLHPDQFIEVTISGVSWVPLREIVHKR